MKFAFPCGLVNERKMHKYIPIMTEYKRVREPKNDTLQVTLNLIRCFF